MDVAVIGGPDDVAEAERVAATVAAQGLRAASSAGVLALRDNAALIGGASLFVGMDSGPGHIASALGVPVVIVGVHPHGASPGHPAAPERFGPWGDPSRVLVLRPPGHRDPCSDGCEANEPHCILGITVDDVVGVVALFAERALAGLDPE
jgi:heptosyltransferase-2